MVTLFVKGAGAVVCIHVDIQNMYQNRSRTDCGALCGRQNKNVDESREDTKDDGSLQNPCVKWCKSEVVRPLHVNQINWIHS